MNVRNNFNIVEGCFEIASPFFITGWISVPEMPLSDEVSINSNSEKVGAIFFGRPDVEREIGRSAIGFSISLAQPLAPNDLLGLTVEFDESLQLCGRPIFRNAIYQDWQNRLEVCEDDILDLVLGSPFFDADHYSKQAEVPFDSEKDALKHYVATGWEQGLDPHPMFSTKQYLKHNRDVANSALCPLHHFVFSGDLENRTASLDFDCNFYKEKYGSHIPNGVSPYHHYLRHGYYLGFSPVPWLDSSTIAKLSSHEEFISVPEAYREKYAKLKAPHFAIEEADLSHLIAPKKLKGTIDIIIPFYKEPHLIKLCLEALFRCESELKKLNCRVIAILDSPDDKLSLQAFHTYTKKFAALNILPLVNKVNIGFVASTNIGLRIAVEAGSDALLLNSDCFLVPGSLSEMLKVLRSDPLIGFVNPRTNNATIATLPRMHVDLADHFNKFKDISEKLPEKTYTPTCVGFCMLIDNSIIRNFGLLDLRYGSGYNEENDLVARANRRGFRAAMANRAYAFHVGGSSFKHTDGSSGSNADLLNQRYPEFSKYVELYFDSRDYYFERLSEGFATTNNGKLKLLIDLSNLGGHSNGTTLMAKKLLSQMKNIESAFEIFVVTNATADKFHNFSAIVGENIFLSWDEVKKKEASFAHIFRMGQPFKRNELKNIFLHGATTSYYMLDAIVYDCAYLYEKEIQKTWDAVFSLSDAIIYQSKFTRDQFESRYTDAKTTPSLVSYHSLDLNEYKIQESNELRKIVKKSNSPVLNRLLASEYTLIVGNHFYHKDVQSTYDRFVAEFPNDPVVVIGNTNMVSHPTNGLNSVFLKSGDIDQEVMDFLYLNTKEIIFPSFYEGFGFPIIDALANGKRIYLRNNEINKEIISNVLDNNSIATSAVFYNDYSDLIKLYSKDKHEPQTKPIKVKGGPLSHHNWHSSAVEILKFLETIVKNGVSPKVFTRKIYIDGLQ